MTRPNYLFGFQVVGPVSETRRLVDAAAAFSAHCGADPRSDPHCEIYLSAFRFGADFREYLEARRTTKGFAGSCWSPWLWFDFDHPDDIEAALRDARKLAGFVLERYPTLDEEALLYFFSGRKGYHIGVPLVHNPDPSPVFHLIARRLAEGLAPSAGVRIDSAIYDRVRCFRAANSTHPKTKLHKRRLTHAELFGPTSARIVELAQEPAPFEVPGVGEMSAELESDWHEAGEAIGRETAARIGRPHPGRLQQATTEFLTSGAEEGERHPRLFRAAADMAELAGVRGLDSLIHALLTDPALDTGLSPSEVERQIRCGIEHGQRQAAQTGGAS